MLDHAGKTVTVHVVATLDDSLLEGVFIDWAEMHQFVADPTSLPVQIFANQTSLPAAIAAIDSAGVQADVTDRDGYIRQLGDTRKANTYRSNVGLFGTIYLMSVISLVQAAVSGPTSVVRSGLIEVDECVCSQGLSQAHVAIRLPNSNY